MKIAIVAAVVVFGCSAHAGETERTEIDRMQETVCPRLPDGPAAWPSIYRMHCGIQFANIANDILYRSNASAGEIQMSVAKAKEMVRYYESGSYRISKPPR